MDKETIQLVASITGGVAVGLGVGIFLTRDHYRVKYELEANEQIESVKDAFQRRTKTGDYETPEKAVEVLIPIEQQSPLLLRQQEIVKEQGYVMVEGERYDAGPDGDDDEEAEAKREEIHMNAFEKPLPERHIGKPYVISVDEYHEDNEYEKVSLTYYDVDGVLADDADKIISDIKGVLGDGLGYFGVGSQDEVIVYVKNEKLGTIFEVVKDDQSYSKLILGLKETDSDRPRARARRELSDE